MLILSLNPIPNSCFFKCPITTCGHIVSPIKGLNESLNDKMMCPYKIF